MESIKKSMSGQPTAQDFMAAANYFYRTDKDIAQAKKWMDEGMKLNKNPQFYQLYSQALIHEKAGNKDSAIKIAQESLEASKKAGNSDYIDRKSTRLNSSHVAISYAVFCLKKK